MAKDTAPTAIAPQTPTTTPMTTLREWLLRCPPLFFEPPSDPGSLLALALELDEGREPPLVGLLPLTVLALVTTSIEVAPVFECLEEVGVVEGEIESDDSEEVKAGEEEEVVDEDDVSLVGEVVIGVEELEEVEEVGDDDVEVGVKVGVALFLLDIGLDVMDAFLEDVFFAVCVSDAVTKSLKSAVESSRRTGTAIKLSRCGRLSAAMALNGRARRSIDETDETRILTIDQPRGRENREAGVKDWTGHKICGEKQNERQ